ncbi:hypothetical protein LshimejAT787_1205270 [Lyophyllum shimeji]|uniref:C2H2-type domain-containing protein n=1 Tax=Lyophyllum shimeji TaxID=47721 RepID=A0A9P3PW34_LYOSH|nr:hypothetical protein LshimejAT787_1205270 [Lyophyllum shimeji]
MSSTSTSSHPLRWNEDFFVFEDVESMMAELGQGSEVRKIDGDSASAGQDAPHHRQEYPPAPPHFIPEEDTSYFSGDGKNRVPTPPPAEQQLYGGPFEPTNVYEQQPGASFVASSTVLVPSTFSFQEPVAQALAGCPAQLVAAGLNDFQYPSLSTAAVLPHSSHLPPAFFQSLPHNLYATRSDDLPLLFPIYSPQQHEQPTPDWLSADSPANSVGSAEATSSTVSSQTFSHSSSRLDPPEYLPSIRARLATGVLCAKIYYCQWGPCRTEIRLEGTTEAAELAFHRLVAKHIDRHASEPAQYDGRRVCRWAGECPSTGRFKERRDMDRHIKTHVPWKYYCEYCEGTYSRERKRHLRACAAYRQRGSGR